MSEGSFPHSIPEEGDSAASDEAPTRPLGRVLDFPADEATVESKQDGIVDAQAWSGDASASVDGVLLRPASFDVDRRGELVVFPRSPQTEKRKRPVEVSGTQKTQAPTPRVGAPPTEPEGPRYLASELLREDLHPAEPMKRTLRYGSLTLGAAGAAIAIGVGGTTTFAIVLASLFALAALAGLAPLAPRFRGAVVAVAGVAGASVACFLEVQRGQLAAPLLAGCVVLSAGGLFYRAAHRSSRVARAMAGFGLVATALFLGLTGGLDALVVEDTSWQSWIGPGSRFLLIAVALGGVLTFLDPRGHGGAWIAGGAFLGWLLIYSGAEVLLEVMPNRAPMRLDLLTDPETLAPATVPFFVTLAAGGVLQVLAWLVRPRAA